jgi:N-acetylmuramic acid 6-phosphate etherase
VTDTPDSLQIPGTEQTPGTEQIPGTERISDRYRELDAWPLEGAAHAMWEGQMDAVAAVRPALAAIVAAVEAAVPRLAAGGRLVYCGAGTSGRIGVQDGAELPPTFDWPESRLVLLMAGGEAAFTRSIENAEDDRAAAETAVAVNGIGENDVVLCVAASGNTPFTTAAVAAARTRGALTIGLANSGGGTLLMAAEHRILVETGPEVIAGSTRMKAGTAQKVVLNLFSTLVMVRLGRVHQGLMVDMLARNAKLRARAIRMLRHLTGRDDAAIEAALAATNGRVKPAVLVLHGLASDQAEACLEANGGRLRDALASL